MTILTSCFCNNTFITYTYSNNILMKRKIGRKKKGRYLIIYYKNDKTKYYTKNDIQHNIEHHTLKNNKKITKPSNR